MKKFFYSLVLCLTVATSASAQSTEQKQFVINRFPSYMPEYVFANATVVSVDEKYAKKHDNIYQYVDLEGKGYQGTLRVGDTVLVFKGEAFYSKGQNLFMTPVVVEKVAKAPKMPKPPKSPEQKAKDVETFKQILQTGTNILTRRVNMGYANTGGVRGF